MRVFAEDRGFSIRRFNPGEEDLGGAEPAITSTVLYIEVEGFAADISIAI